MSRATVVYVGMIVVFVAGLWGVLAVGGGLVAPEDLGGRWAAVAPDGGRWAGLTVEQSGKYFQLSFDGGPAVGLTLADESGGAVSLARGKWRVTIDRPGPASHDADAGDVRTFHIDGPNPGTFTGRRARPTTRGAS